MVANHQAITTAVRRSKLYVEPPLLPNGPFVQQVAAALPGSSRSAAPTHAAPAPVSIGVIRLCDYDPAVTRMTSISARNGVLYTRRHGYTMYMEGASLDATRPAAWSKVPRCRCRGVRRCRVTRCVPPLSPPQIAALRKYLWEHDWVLWMDCDSLFMNMDTSLESVLMSALAASEHPEAVNVVVSNDGTMVNTGTASWLSASRVCCGLTPRCAHMLAGLILVRRCPWSDAFLQRVYDAHGGVFVGHPFWEQAAVHFMLNDAPQWRQTREHVQFVPQWWINRCGARRKRVCVCARRRSCMTSGVWCTASFRSYPEELAAMLPMIPTVNGTLEYLHATYRPGQFIASFSGCVIMLGSRDYCNSLFASYADVAEAALRPQS